MNFGEIVFSVLFDTAIFGIRKLHGRMRCDC